MDSDRIYISQLKVDGHFGVSDRERRREQTVLVDASLTCDISRAAETDDIADTVSYSEVVRLILDLADGGEYRLLEKFAIDCADKILAAFPVTAVRIKVRKSHPSSTAYMASAGVEVERSR